MVYSEIFLFPERRPSLRVCRSLSRANAYLEPPLVRFSCCSQKPAEDEDTFAPINVSLTGTPKPSPTGSTARSMMYTHRASVPQQRSSAAEEAINCALEQPVVHRAHQMVSGQRLVQTA